MTAEYKRSSARYKKADRRKVHGAIREIVQGGDNSTIGIVKGLISRGFKKPDGGVIDECLVSGQLSQMRKKGFRPLKRFVEPNRVKPAPAASLHRLPTSIILLMEDGDLTAVQKLRIVKAYLSEVE